MHGVEAMDVLLKINTPEKFFKAITHQSLHVIHKLSSMNFI